MLLLLLLLLFKGGVILQRLPDGTHVADGDRREGQLRLVDDVDADGRRKADVVSQNTSDAEAQEAGHRQHHHDPEETLCYTCNALHDQVRYMIIIYTDLSFTQSSARVTRQNMVQSTF